MKKAIILSIMVMFCGVAFAQVPASTNVVTFEKTNADVGVQVTRDKDGKVLSAIAITKKQLEGQLTANTSDRQKIEAKLAVLNAN